MSLHHPALGVQYGVKVTSGDVPREAPRIQMRDHKLFRVVGWDVSRLDVWPPQYKQRSRLYAHLQWLLERSHVLLQTAPLAGCVVAARYGNLQLNKMLKQNKGIQSPLDYTILAPMITAAAFIMGTVLSNVMSDYKESEKIPAELTGYFYTLLSYARTECAIYGKDPRPALKEVEVMLLAIMATVDGNVSFNEALKCFEDAWQEYCRIFVEICEEEGGK